MLEMMNASADYQMLVDLVTVSEGIEGSLTADEMFDTVCAVAATFPAGSMAAQLAESLGLRFAD